MTKTRIDEIIDQLNMMDDDFFTAVLQGYPDVGLHIIQTIMGDTPLVFTETSSVQFVLKNLARRSLQFDFHTSAIKAQIDLEMQKKNEGASPRRLRLHSSLLDSWASRKGDDFVKLDDIYVIFITQNDIMKAGKPVYHIERVNLETGQLFDDGSHLLYVNGSYQGDDAIGRLMHDLRSSDPDNIYDKELKEAVTFFKKTKEGRKQMSELISRYFKEELDAARAEAAAAAAAKTNENTRKENALTMLKDGKLGLDDVARYSGLSIDQVRELKSSFRN